MASDGMSSDVLLDEWSFFRDTFSFTPAHVATRLGMREETFIRALDRAEAKGDPRAYRPKDEDRRPKK